MTTIQLSSTDHADYWRERHAKLVDDYGDFNPAKHFDVLARDKFAPIDHCDRNLVLERRRQLELISEAKHEITATYCDMGEPDPDDKRWDDTPLQPFIVARYWLSDDD